MEGRSEERVHESKISPRVFPRWVTVIRAVSLHYSVFILQAFLIAPLFVWGFSSYQGITTHPKLSKKFQRLNENHFRRKIPVIIVPNFETRVNHCVACNMIWFYHSKRCGKSITCSPRASTWVWKMYSDFRCIFCWSLLGTAGPLRRRK